MNISIRQSLYVLISVVVLACAVALTSSFSTYKKTQSNLQSYTKLLEKVSILEKFSQQFWQVRYKERHSYFYDSEHTEKQINSIITSLQNLEKSLRENAHSAIEKKSSQRLNNTLSNYYNYHINQRRISQEISSELTLQNLYISNMVLFIKHDTHKIIQFALVDFLQLYGSFLFSQNGSQLANLQQALENFIHNSAEMSQVQHIDNTVKNLLISLKKTASYFQKEMTSKQDLSQINNDMQNQLTILQTHYKRLQQSMQEKLANIIDEFTYFGYIIIILVILPLIIYSFFLSRRVLRPIQQLTDIVDHIYAGNFSARYEETKGNRDEFELFGRAFNRMFEASQKTKEELINVAEELKTEHAKAEFYAYRDALTELPNRRSLLNYLDYQIEEKTNAPFSLLFIDLDKFKNINDLYGHDVGDEQLCNVAQRIQNVCREADLVSRIGGDEFVVTISHLLAEQDILDLAEELIKTVSEPYFIRGNIHHIGASVGIAHYPKDAKDTSSLLKRADLAMYHSKTEGRGVANNYTDEMEAELRERIAVENAIRTGLENKEFTFYYQPKIRLEDFTVVGAEALLRWIDATGTAVSPNVFIPVSEESDFVDQVTHTSLEILARDMKYDILPYLADSPIGECRIAFNLSEKQFKSATLISDAQAILNHYQIDPRYIELEITEAAIMDDYDQAIRTLQHLVKLGFHIAIDDFGTGYFSIVQLQKLPVTTLKIDRSLVSNISSKEDSRAIIEAIMYLAKVLDLEVVAEGVETIEQVEFLRSVNCLYCQGYLFAKPMPYNEALKITSVIPKEYKEEIV